MGIRAVLFDLGNTLVSYYALPEFPPILRQSLRACADLLDCALSFDQEEQLLARALGFNVERADHRVWPLRERLSALFGTRGALLPGLEQAFLEPIFALARADPAGVPLLRELRARGVRTGVVSNTPWGSCAEPWRGELERHGLLRELDVAVFCSDVGFRKPHAAPFVRALSRLDVDAADALFVGDDPHWDVEGARRAGLRPVCLSAGELVPRSDCESIRCLADVLTLLPAAAR